MKHICIQKKYQNVCYAYFKMRHFPHFIEQHIKEWLDTEFSGKDGIDVFLQRCPYVGYVDVRVLYLIHIQIDVQMTRQVPPYNLVPEAISRFQIFIPISLCWYRLYSTVDRSSGFGTPIVLSLEARRTLLAVCSSAPS